MWNHVDAAQRIQIDVRGAKNKQDAWSLALIHDERNERSVMSVLDENRYIITDIHDTPYIHDSEDREKSGERENTHFWRINSKSMMTNARRERKGEKKRVLGLTNPKQ